MSKQTYFVVDTWSRNILGEFDRPGAATDLMNELIDADPRVARDLLMCWLPHQDTPSPDQ